MLCTTRACKILFYFKLLVITCIVVAMCFQAFLPSHISTGLFESSTLVYVQYIHVLCTVPYNMIHIRVVQKMKLIFSRVLLHLFVPFGERIISVKFHVIWESFTTVTRPLFLTVYMHNLEQLHIMETNMKNTDLSK